MLRVKRGPCTVGFLPICPFLVVYRLTGQKREALCTGMSYEEELRSPLAVRLVLNMCFVLLFSVMFPHTMSSSTWAKSIRRSSKSYPVYVCVCVFVCVCISVCVCARVYRYDVRCLCVGVLGE